MRKRLPAHLSCDPALQHAAQHAAQAGRPAAAAQVPTLVFRSLLLHLHRSQWPQAQEYRCRQRGRTQEKPQRASSSEKVLGLTRKGQKSCAEVAKRAGRTNPLSGKSSRRKGASQPASLSSPQDAKVTGTVKVAGTPGEDGEGAEPVGGGQEQPARGPGRQRPAPEGSEPVPGLERGVPERRPFAASKGWLHRLRSRLGLRSAKGAGEAGTARELAAAPLPAERKSRLRIKDALQSQPSVVLKADEEG